jgi:hypothetical protein
MVTFAEINALFPGWYLVILIFLVVLFLASGGIITFVFLSRRRWNIKVMLLHKNIASSGSHIAGWDRARLVGLLPTGEEIYYWKKRKKFRIGNEIYVGGSPKVMAWARGSDWYYRNVGFDDVDKRLKRMGITPTDINMRMATGVVDQAIQERHDSRTFLEKWAVPITIGMLILAILVTAGGNWWSAHEANKGKATDLEVAKTNKEVAQLSKEILITITNLRGGGTGLIPA